MASGKTISRNRFFDPAGGPATIAAKASGTKFAISAFLDLELEDVKNFSGDKLLSADGVSATIAESGTHVLEFIVAFKSTASSCTIECSFTANDGAKQQRTSTVSGAVNDIARVSFHAPVE